MREKCYNYSIEFVLTEFNSLFRKMKAVLYPHTENVNSPASVLI